MMKTFLAVIAEDKKVPEDLTKLVRALLNFAYLAHSAQITDMEVDELDDALLEMQSLKKVLVRKEIYENIARLDDIPKWHMVTHYPECIRELGTPDGYNTEAPEYLHIVFVKRGWTASNKRDAIPQIIQFCQRLEAIRMHRAYLEDFYGASKPDGKPRTTAVLVDEEEEEVCVDAKKGAGHEEEEDWDDIFEDEEDDDEGDDDDVGVEGEPSPSDLASDIEYPNPIHALAMRPTRTKLCGSDLAEEYGARDLLPALKGFLGAAPHGQRLFLLASDFFDVWHKVTLNHLPLSFAPNEPLQRDVIRAQPATPDGRGGMRRQPTFDTVLFLNDPNAFGLHRKFRLSTHPSLVAMLTNSSLL
jgi:hypothetical protein